MSLLNFCMQCGAQAINVCESFTAVVLSEALDKPVLKSVWSCLLNELCVRVGAVNSTLCWLSICHLSLVPYLLPKMPDVTFFPCIQIPCL